MLPPLAAGIPSGAPASAVKDPKQKVEYEAAIEANKQYAEEYRKQYRLRSLERLFSIQAERYLVTAYAKQPYNLDELKKYLDIYLTDQEHKANSGLKDRILKKVEATIARREQESKVTLDPLDNAERQ